MDVLLPVLKWWLALTVIGWAAVPVAMRLFAPLPERGVALARPLGLLVAGYVYWLAVSARVLPNTWPGALFAVLVLIALGAWLGWRDRETIAGYLRRHRALVIGYEWLFFVALAGWALYRAHNPAIETAGGEKYMEMAFLSSALASPSFPPTDPWMSGHAISYYYFGYILSALVTRLTGVLPYVAFNLIVPSVLAMSLLGVFGIGYNLAGLSGARSRWPYLVTGAFGAVLLAVIGSFEGALEIAYTRGIGSERFWRFLDIRNLTVGAGTCGEATEGFGSGGWIPTRFIWWWRGSRVIHDNCAEVIHEFPFFSFMLADSHPHVLALPFGIMAAGLALAVLAGLLDRRDTRPYWSPLWLALPFCVGALGFLNAWDLPTYAFILAIAYGLRAAVRPLEPFRWGLPDLLLAIVAGASIGVVVFRYAGRLLAVANDLPADAQPALGRAIVAATIVAAAAGFAYWLYRGAERGDEGRSRSFDVLRFAVWLAVLAIAFYVPFHVGFRSQASGLGVVAVRSRLPQWLVHFGYLLFLAITLIGLYLEVAWHRRRRITVASLVVLAVLLPVAGLGIGWQAWVAAILALCVAGAGVAAFEVWSRGDSTSPPVPGRDEATLDVRAPVGIEAAQSRSIAPTFALVCVGVGLLLALGTEFVFIRDLFGSRMNTVFKLFFQSWVLLSIGGGYVLYAAWRRMPRALFAVWAIVAAALLAASLAYPVAATYSRTDGFRFRDLTLNGLAWWQSSHPDDVAVVEWLKSHAPAGATILEASGGGYEHNGRISMATGLPTVLGWEGHEHQWRGTREEIDPRRSDVEETFTTRSEARLRELLEKYDVRYVIVGETERSKYGLGDADVRRFDRWLAPVFRAGRTVVYETSLQGR